MSNWIVIKLGGELLRPGALSKSFFSSIEDLSESNSIVVVHGGGPQMSEAAKAHGHSPVIRQGRRVTGDIDLEILKEVLGKKLNQSLVGDFENSGIKAKGLSGADNVVMVEKRPPVEMDGELVDFGWVGDVLEIKTDRLVTISNDGSIPVVATMGTNISGQIFNVNGDTVAAKIAEALRASQLIFATAIGRVLDKEGMPLPKVDSSDYQKGVNESWLQGGMRVKISTALSAMKNGNVASSRICGPDALADLSKSTAIEI